MRALFAHTGDALSFLSRCCSRRLQTAESLVAAVPYFPFAGCILGGSWVLATFLIQFVWSFSSLPSFFNALLCGWVWLCLSLWFSRGMHWDGVADVGDACGSGAQGERFWQILRDSRLGAFGAMTLVAGLLGQWLAASGHCYQQNWLLLVLAPAWARTAVLLLARSVPAHQSGSLGQMMCQAAQSRLTHGMLWGCSAFFLAVLVLGTACRWWQVLLLVCVQGLVIRYLAQQARSHGGISGDFMGACIEYSQLCFLLVTL